MSLSGTIRKVIKEAHLKKILNEGDKVWEPKNGGSPFGMRVHPITGVKKLHGGQDYGEPKGTAIIVINPGKVLRSDFGNANGNFIEILHDDGTVTMYLHLEKRLVNKGDYVSAGKVIGTVGSTGLSTGPHLHFVYKKSQTSSAENPRNFAPKYFKFSNTTTPDVSNIVKPVEKGKTKDYLQYLFNSGKVYNPTKVRISSVGTLKSKKGNENIYGIKRKSDDRVFLFVFNNDFEVSYIEMSLDDFKTKRESRINGTWEKLTKSSVIRDPKSKNQEKSSETTNKEKSKDDKTTNNVMFVGDSLSVGGSTWNYLLEKDHPSWNTTHVVRGGMKTDWMLNNMLPKLAEKKYDKVFIYGGTNDAFWIGTKLSNAVSNVQKMVDAVNKQGGKAYVFLGYDASSVMTDKNLKPTYKKDGSVLCNKECMREGRKRMIQLQKDLSSQISGAKIIPTVEGDGTWAAGDGIHVGPAQHKIMKNHVEKYI